MHDDKYIVVSARGSYLVLQDRVNRKMEDGYIPAGGVSVVLIQRGETYFQAMIKKPA